MIELTNHNGAFLPDDSPSIVLRCGFCAAEIALMFDVETGTDDTYTFGEYELAACSCGATYGEGDTLDIVYS